MFDISAATIKIDRWLHQRLFCADGRVYSISDTLKYLVNKEAAHVDTDQTTVSEDMERVHFGNTCYYHIIAVQTGAYLLSQFQSAILANRTKWQSLLDRRGYTVTEPGTFKEADLVGMEIEPMRMPYTVQETGIPIPSADSTPVNIEESTVVGP